MNQVVVCEPIEKALARRITFPELLATLKNEGVESYHVDFLRNETLLREERRVLRDRSGV